MLTITDNALTVLRRVTNHRRLAESSGLRIARRDNTSDALEVRAVTAPQSCDLVVERDDARLFVGPAAVDRVRGKVLDARTDGDGRVEFLLKAA